MKNEKEKISGDGNATSFTDGQRTRDDAKNERIKSETGSNKIDPQQANNPRRRNLKSGVSEKKTGAGKQSTPGD